MKKFEVLCVTMGRKDFNLYNTMNLNSDVVFANQCDNTMYSEKIIDGNKVKMISTETRGVGVNRNLAVMYATAEICLMSDDDMVYRDGYEKLIIEEYERHPEADIIIFNIGTTTPEFGRIPTVTKKYKKLNTFSRCPYGAPRISFRLNSVKTSNIEFSTYFGGGCLYSNGEDSIWLSQMMNAGLKIYISPIFIGDVSYEQTTWEISDEGEKLYTKGAMYSAGRKKFKHLFVLYYSILKKYKNISPYNAWKLMQAGIKGYKTLKTYKEYKKGKNI